MDSACGGATVTVHLLPRYVPTRRVLQPFGAFGKTVVQHFCETSENCQRALVAAKRSRRGAWLALHKQGQDMIKSSNKRVKLLEVGEI